MLRPDLTVVFGVSGVGKTTACANLAQRRPNFRHITASQLIDRGRLATSRTADQVYATQVEIIERLRDIRESEPRRIILDGHCVIRLATGLYQLPSNFIAEIAPAMIILIEADPETIQKRRTERTSGVETETLDGIAQEVCLTRETCLAYHRDLSIPLRVLNSKGDDIADDLYFFLA